MKDYSKYLAIPYKERGRDFKGVDCWGLVRLFLLNEFKIEIGNFNQYSVANLEEVKQVAEIEKKNWITVQSPEVGDVAEIQMTKRGWHVGVIVHPGLILHISNDRFSEMSTLTSPLICRSIKGYWRYNALPSK
jgi:cell wall-associated NlpC family hydrolase